MKITLASASPRRRRLIRRIDGLEVSIVPSGADEHVEASCPEELVKKLALKKAETVFSDTGGIVVGADTVVVADGRALGKPGDAEEARSFFRMLCGRTHEVITGLSVTDGVRSVTASETTSVTLSRLRRRRNREIYRGRASFRQGRRLRYPGRGAKAAYCKNRRGRGQRYRTSRKFT